MLYKGSVVVSQYDNGISYEVVLHVTAINNSNRLTLSAKDSGTWITLRNLQDFARKLYTMVFTNNEICITDEAGNTTWMKFNSDWTKLQKEGN